MRSGRALSNSEPCSDEQLVKTMNSIPKAALCIFHIHSNQQNEFAYHGTVLLVWSFSKGQRSFKILPGNLQIRKWNQSLFHLLPRQINVNPIQVHNCNRTISNFPRILLTQGVLDVPLLIETCTRFEHTREIHLLTSTRSIE